MDGENSRSHERVHDDAVRNAPDPALFEKSLNDARTAVDRSRNLRQAIALRRVLRTLQRKASQES